MHLFLYIVIFNITIILHTEDDDDGADDDEETLQAECGCGVDEPTITSGTAPTVVTITDEITFRII